MENKKYNSDLTSEQWKVIEKLIPPAKAGWRPRDTNTREVINGIFYVLKTGCQWRSMPNDFPPWGTVYTYFAQWERDGTWEAIHEVLKKKSDAKMNGRHSRMQR